MPTDAEQKYSLAREEYSVACKAFYEIRIGMPRDKRLRSLSQRTDYEYARLEVSKAAKRMQDAYILLKSEEFLSEEIATETQKERFGAPQDPKFQEIARIMLEGIEKGRRK